MGVPMYICVSHCFVWYPGGAQRLSRPTMRCPTRPMSSYPRAAAPCYSTFRPCFQVDKKITTFFFKITTFLLPMTRKQNKPHHNVIIAGSTIAVALSQVSSGGRALGTDCGVHRHQCWFDNCSGAVASQQWRSRHWNALWRP